MAKGYFTFHLLQGSGLSDGEWVTLGAREVDDLEVINAYRATNIEVVRVSTGLETSFLPLYLTDTCVLNARQL